jgi:putative SOS response-associated peptidase YedK
VRSGRSKQPFLFRLRDGGLFACAGLWEVGRDRDGNEVEACAILTTEANELVGPAHDRMPVILDPRHYAEWLGPGLADVEAFLLWFRPYSSEAMEAFPVSALVNSARHEGPDCAQPWCRSSQAGKLAKPDRFSGPARDGLPGK